MEDAICSGLLEVISGCIHHLSGRGEGTSGEYLDVLCVSDAGTSIDDLLSGFLEVLRESSELLYFSFDKGVA